MDEEQPLVGGNTGAVRVGDTVRKQWSASTPSVVSFVNAVRAGGVDTPAPLGRDAQGRQVQEFVPGQLAVDADPLSLPQLRQVGAMVRAIHDTSEHFVPAADAIWESDIPTPGSDLVCHNDLAPWNLLVGERLVFFDWDAATPSTRLWDLAYSAQTFTLSDPQLEPEIAASRLAAFVDGYGADKPTRQALPSTMYQRAATNYGMLRVWHASGQEPLASLYLDGHGARWESATRYVAAHQELWADALMAR